MADRRFVFMGEEEKIRCEVALDKLIESWDALSCGREENVHEKIAKLFKLTASSILQANWLNIKPELKCRLNSALQNCLCRGKSRPESLSLISALIEVSNTDSWFNTALATILSDQTTDSNVIGSLKHYCGTMNPEILWLQLQSLVQDGRDELALKFCTCCLNYSSLKEEERVNDMYYRLLFQLGLIDRLTKELLSSYSCEKGMDFVNRVLTSSNNDALSFASCLIQIFLVRDIFSQTTYSYTKNLMEMWINVLHKLHVTSQILWEQVMMLASIFTTSAHYYLIVDLLFAKFGSKLLRLYVELYIKGLTVDLNYLENARMEQTSDVNELEVHFANVLCKLAQILGDHSLLARECFLSAFSINPTKGRLNQLQQFAVTEDKKRISNKKFELCSGFCHCTIQGACRQSPKNTCETAIEDEVKNVLSDVLDRISESEIDPWNISHYIFEEQSQHLPEEVLEDLTIVLDEPRNKTLSWELNWTELKNRCEIYLETKSAMKVMMSSLASTREPQTSAILERKVTLPIANASNIKYTCKAVSTKITPSATSSTTVKLKRVKQDEVVPTEPCKVPVSEANPTFYLDRPTNETSFLKEALTRTNLIKLVRVTDLKAKGEPVLLEELRRREFNKSQSLVSFKSVPFFNAIPASSTTKEEQVETKTVAASNLKQIHPPPAQSIESSSKIVQKSSSVLVKTHGIVPGIQVQCDNPRTEPSLATNEATKISSQKTNTFIHVTSASNENLLSKMPLLAHTALVKAGLTMEQMNPKVVISHSDMVDANKLLINNEKVLVGGTHGTVALAIGSKDKTKSPNGVNPEVLKDEKSPKKPAKKLVINNDVGASIQLPVVQIVSPVHLQPGITSAENKINFMTLTQSTPKTASSPVQIYTSPLITSSVVIPVHADQKSIASQTMLGSLPSTTRLHVKLVDNTVTFSKNTVAVAHPASTTGSYVLFNARCTVVNPNASSSTTNAEKIQMVPQPNVVAMQTSVQSGAEFTKTINNGSGLSTTVQRPCIITTTNSLAKTEERLANTVEETIPLSEALLNLCDADDEPGTGNPLVDPTNDPIAQAHNSTSSEPPTPLVAPECGTTELQETEATDEDDPKNKPIKSDGMVTLYSDSGTVASANFDSNYKWMVLGEKEANRTMGRANSKPLGNQVMMVPHRMVNPHPETMTGMAQQLLTVNSVVIPAQVQTSTDAFGTLVEPEAKNARKGKLFPSRKKTGPKWMSVRNQHGGMEYRLLKGSPEKAHQKKVAPKGHFKSVASTASAAVPHSTPLACVGAICNSNQVKKVELSSLKTVQMAANAKPPPDPAAERVTKKLHFPRFVAAAAADCGNVMINPYSLQTISNLRTFKVNKPDTAKAPKATVVPKTAEDEKIMKILDEYKEQAKSNPKIVVSADKSFSPVLNVPSETVEPVCEPVCLPQIEQPVQVESIPQLTDEYTPPTNQVLTTFNSPSDSPLPANLHSFLNDVQPMPLNETTTDIHTDIQMLNIMLEQPQANVNANANTKKKPSKKKKSPKPDEAITANESPKKKPPRKSPANKVMCPQCGKDFSNGYNMNRHLKTVHNQTTSVKISPRKPRVKVKQKEIPPPAAVGDGDGGTDANADADAVADANIEFINEERVDESLEKYFSNENNCSFAACISDLQPSLSDMVSSDFERGFNLFSDPEMSESACLANDNSSNAEIKSDFNTGYVEENINNFAICNNLQTSNSPRTILERFSYIKKEPDEEEMNNYQKTIPPVPTAKNENEETEDASRSKTGRMRARNSSHGSKRCGCCDSNSDSSKKFRSDTTTRALRQVRITKLRVMPLEGKQTKSVLRR